MEEARQAEATAKPARTRKVAKADPLAEIKDALAAGTWTGPEAIDRAYRLGFEVGEQAARKCRLEKTRATDGAIRPEA